VKGDPAEAQNALSTAIRILHFAVFENHDPQPLPCPREQTSMTLVTQPDDGDDAAR
jgi:hypothetical protein